MKRLVLIFTAIIAFATLLSSCAEDTVKLSKDLDGTWVASSFTANGIEQIGLDLFFAKITGLEITFADEGEGAGTIKQTLTVEALGFPTSESASGTYQVVGDNNETLRMTYVTDSTTDVSEGPFTIDGSELMLSYNEGDSIDYVIKATKQ
ncbi:MAG: hypothetical protein AB8F95_00090 [Bacteroidia bacterium]